jgi:hypothetical protein
MTPVLRVTEAGIQARTDTIPHCQKSRRFPTRGKQNTIQPDHMLITRVGGSKVLLTRYNSVYQRDGP